MRGKESEMILGVPRLFFGIIVELFSEETNQFFWIVEWCDLIPELSSISRYLETYTQS